MPKETTVIRISTETKERLLKLGRMHETFDQLINRILDEWEELKREKD